MALMEYVAKYGPWVWFIAAVLLFMLETVVPGVHFLWFGLAAAVVGVLTLATGITWHTQLVVFILTALATVFAVRRMIGTAQPPTDAPHLNVRGSEFIGRLVLVEEAIRGGRGKVRAGDTLWVAEGEDAAKGARVEVTGVHGTALVVINKDSE